jgi:hypothetical protein
VRFNESNNLSESRVIIKKMGKVKEIANFLIKNILNKKKKKALISIFIINIRAKFEGGKKKAKIKINISINNINGIFFVIF